MSKFLNGKGSFSFVMNKGGYWIQGEKDDLAALSVRIFTLLRDLLLDCVPEPGSLGSGKFNQP